MAGGGWLGTVAGSTVEIELEVLQGQQLRPERVPALVRVAPAALILGGQRHHPQGPALWGMAGMGGSLKFWTLVFIVVL